MTPPRLTQSLRAALAFFRQLKGRLGYQQRHRCVTVRYFKALQGRVERRNDLGSESGALRDGLFSL